jgi:hypothetical protein
VVSACSVCRNRLERESRLSCLFVIDRFVCNAVLASDIRQKGRFKVFHNCQQELHVSFQMSKIISSTLGMNSWSYGRPLLVRACSPPVLLFAIVLGSVTPSGPVSHQSLDLGGRALNTCAVLTSMRVRLQSLAITASVFKPDQAKLSSKTFPGIAVDRGGQRILQAQVPITPLAVCKNVIFFRGSDLLTLYPGGRIDLEHLRALTTELEVKMVQRGVCISKRTVRIDGTTDARRLSEALAGLHNEEKKVRELEAKKRELEQAIAALKQSAHLDVVPKI